MRNYTEKMRDIIKNYKLLVHLKKMVFNRYMLSAMTYGQKN